MWKVGFVFLVSLILFSCKENSPNFYSVDIAITPEGSGIVKPAQDTLIEENASLSITAIANEGYSFIGWSGDMSSTENPLNLTITEDVNITANFELKTYELTIEIIGNGIVTEAIIQQKMEYEHGTTIKLKAFPEEGWAFKNWGGDFESDDDSLIVEIIKPMFISAKFEELTPFCVPEKIQAFVHDVSGDSALILNYEIVYDGQFIESYRKEIDYSKGLYLEFGLNGGNYSLEYENGNITKYNSFYDSGVTGENTFEWNEYSELIRFDFIHTQTGGTIVMKSEQIDYESCGIKYFESGKVSNFDGHIDRAVSKIDYLYSNDCMESKININPVIRRYENIPSVFIDVLGFNGLVGWSYEDFISESGFTPITSFQNKRLKEVEYEYGRERYSNKEIYEYFDFISDSLYPQYFVRLRSDSKDNSVIKDSFKLDYFCGYSQNE